MLDMEAIKNFSIDKSNWKKVKFGDVVFEPKESVKDPIAEGVEHVVGLEHIDSEEIYLRRSNTIEGSTTFTRKFCKGDVLFGRRRAYLKKASKAPFEGICSGDIIVMRAREELLLPELLPFIVNNDKFFDFAIKHSAGGLSPRVKFKDLANYEFDLPPILIQNKLSELLWSVNNQLESKVSLSNKANNLINSLIYGLITLGEESYLKPKNFKNIPFEDLVVKEKGGIRRGPFGSTLRKEYFVEQGVKVYEQSNVIRNDFKRGKYFIDSDKFERLKSFEILPKDILISCSGTVGKVAVVPEGIEKGIMNQALLRARLNEELILPKYFKYLFESEVMQLKLLQKTQGSAMKNLVALSEMKKINFPVVDRATQLKVISIIENQKWLNIEPVVQSKRLQNSLINQVF